MVHFHGTPITPNLAATVILRGRHAMVSFADHRQIQLVADVCSSFVLDNGAYSFWKSQKHTKWSSYYKWVETWRSHPGFRWAVIPDVIDGSSKENDKLITKWPTGLKHCGVPVWHLHETDDRLKRLCSRWPVVALGSSGKFASIGTQNWWIRMSRAMVAACDAEGRPRCQLHGLRMLRASVVSYLPLASGDSCNIARNIGIDKAWKGAYSPQSKGWRGLVLASRIESAQSAPRWSGQSQLEAALRGSPWKGA